MSRGLTSGQLTASAGVHRKVAPLIECLFDSGALRLTLAPFDILVGTDNYIAVGPLVTVDQLRESSTSTEGMQFTMTGLDISAMTIATQEPYRGRIVRLMKAYLDADTNQIINTPKVIFIGRMKSMAIGETNEQCTITLTAEHYEAELKRAAPVRYNNADQQRFYPGDKGCEYVEKTTDMTLIWPTLEAMKH